MTTTALRVWPMNDDGCGYVVRGTTDPLKAKRAVQRFRLNIEAQDTRDAVRVPPLHRAGLFRWNPCSPRSCFDGGGHCGHLDHSDHPGRGVWPGVYFTW